MVESTHPQLSIARQCLLLGISRKRIARLMRKMGLCAIYQKPNTSKPFPGHKIYPYLLKGMAIDAPNQVWSCLKPQ